MRTMEAGAWWTGLAAAVLLAAMTGCGGDDNGGTGTEEPVPTVVEVSPESAMLTSINATQGFTAVVRDQNGKAMPNATVSWSSSDAAVFTVSPSGLNATVEAVGNGNGTLTATSGQASGTAEVEVEQVPAKLEVVSGDDQEGLRGATLPEPLVVRVEDQGGTGAAGVSVTFLPDEGSGSVSETMVVTDQDGMASTEWTLGADERMQSLEAFLGEITQRFRATATADPPLADLELTTMTLSREELTVHETVDVTTEIVNLGDGATPPAFKLAVVVGQHAETIEVDQLQPGASVTVNVSLGPFQIGSHTIDVMLDPDDELDEWAEDNNSASGLVDVVDQKLISPGESVELSASAGGPVFLYRVEIDEASDKALSVELSGGEGDADLFVHYADRPDHQYRYMCGSLSPATTEICQMVPTRQGVYHVAVHAWSAFGPTTLTVTAGGEPVEDYTIDLEFVEGGTTDQHDIVREAAERWESVIVKGADDVDFSEDPSNACGPGSSVATDVVDDLRIYITIDSIDGAGDSDGNAVAVSDWCLVRAYDTSPQFLKEVITGYIHLDEDDVQEMEPGVLRSVVMHEMAHVFAFDPLIWRIHGHLQDPSLPRSPEADTHFDGYLAIAAFDAAGGTGYEGAKVPVENGGVIGSSDQHWRQSVFGDELMTPLLTGTSQPLSLITIELLADLGFGVDLSQAESFSLSPAGRAGMALPRGPVIDLSHDVGRGPVGLYDVKTGRVRVIHRSR